MPGSDAMAMASCQMARHAQSMVMQVSMPGQILNPTVVYIGSACCQGNASWLECTCFRAAAQSVLQDLLTKTLSATNISCRSCHSKLIIAVPYMSFAAEQTPASRTRHAATKKYVCLRCAVAVCGTPQNCVESGTERVHPQRGSERRDVGFAAASGGWDRLTSCVTSPAAGRLLLTSWQ